MESKKVKITFGLQEKHVKRINEERARWNQPDSSIPGTPPDAIYIEGFWDQLATEIGWAPFTLAMHYMRKESRIDNNTGYRSLWDYLHSNHNVLLLESEVGDLVHFVYKFHPKQEPGSNELVAENERLKADFRKAIDDFREASLKVIDAKEQVEKERDTLKERCEKMEAALKEIITMSNAGKTLSHIDSHVAARARKALKEGESNTPPPDLQAKGNDIALALRRLCRSVSVHPEYSNDSEWGGYVSFAEEKLSAWESNTPAAGEGKEVGHE